MLDERGRVTLRGSAFRSRGLEPFVRRLIEQAVRLLMTDRAAEVKAVVDAWLADFAARRVPVRLFARTESLAEPLDVYAERVRAGLRRAAPAYEVARAAGRPFQPGDQVSYYIAGRGAGAGVAEQARLAADWRADRPDENTEYYQGKVLEIWARFRPFAEDPSLRPPAEPIPEPDLQLELFEDVGGPEMAPHTPRRSGHTGAPGAPLDLDLSDTR
jgi:hypothetical protein